MPVRSVELSEHSDHFIEESVESGRFQDASQTVSEALRLLEEREHEEAAKLEWLRAAAKEGFDALDRGEFKSFHSMNELEDYVRGIFKEVRSELVAGRMIA